MCDKNGKKIRLKRGRTAVPVFPVLFNLLSIHIIARRIIRFPYFCALTDNSIQLFL